MSKFQKQKLRTDTNMDLQVQNMELPEWFISSIIDKRIKREEERIPKRRNIVREKKKKEEEECYENKNIKV